ncbi:MAG: hypothetical protein U1F71_05830 [Verrucomicrobiaceae bacterium]
MAAKTLKDLGFALYGTSSGISEAGIPVNILPKLASGQRPNVIDLMKNKDMALVINTPSGKNPLLFFINCSTSLIGVWPWPQGTLPPSVARVLQVQVRDACVMLIKPNGCTPANQPPLTLT